MPRLLILLIVAFPLSFQLIPEKKEPRIEVAIESKQSKAIDTIVPLTDTLKNYPELKVKDPQSGKKSELRVSTLNVDVKVSGNFATTTFDMLFYNETDRVLEGELIFPLGDGQTISRFALDVNGKLREGVVVEKEKGQQVFESTIRRKVDPGLLEHVQGNSYKARVYPIPAKGHKRLVIAFEQNLNYDGKEWIYLLPMHYPYSIDEFHLKTEVVQQEIEPIPYQNELANMSFKKIRSSYLAEVNEKDYKANQQIGFAIPTDKDRQIYTSTQNNENYFCAILHPNLPEVKRNPVSSTLLVWDVSTSGEKRDHAKEFALLDKYFKHHQNLVVYPVLFAHEIIDKVKSFRIVNGNWNELRLFLSSLSYDGASSMGCLNFQDFKLGNRYSDEALLFSDGLSNFSESNPSLSSYPVSTIITSQNADHGVMKKIALSSGGSCINLMTETVESGLNKMIHSDYRIKSIVSSDKSVYDVAGISTIITENTLIISGKYNGNRTMFTLVFQAGNQAEIPFIVTLNGVNQQSEMDIQRIWSWKKFEDLELLNPENKKENAAFAKENKLVTPYTSLIVLDELEDYVQHRIVPPIELQTEYWKMVETEVKAQNDAKESHMEAVVQMFLQRLEWWNTDFSKQKKETTSTKVVEHEINEESASEGVSMDSISFSQGRLEGISNNVNAGNVTVSGTYSIQVTDANGATSYQFNAGDGADLDIGFKNKQGYSGTTTLDEWNPDMPYLREIKKASEGTLYSTYLKQKVEHGNSPAFYIDVSDYFISLGKKQEALRVLSNVVEIELMNYKFMRILAHRLLQLGYVDYSIALFRKVLEIRPEEPQSYRDLALALERKGEYNEAIALLYHIVENPWDGRFPEIELIALEELNSIAARYPKSNVSKVQEKLRKAMPCDIRVVVTWDTDNCDLDLWVTDPNGELCKYDHSRTAMGGLISRDFTGGYGPEEFLLKKATKGKYKVQINYYGTSEQTLTGPATIQVKMIRSFGTPFEKTTEVTRRLSTAKEVVDIGSFEY